MFLIDKLWSLLGDYYPFSPPICPFDQGESQVKELFQKHDYQQIFEGSIPGTQRLSVGGYVSVLALTRAPQVVLKIADRTVKVYKSYYVHSVIKRDQESNALELRAKVAERFREIIQKNGLNLLYVPKKRVVEVLPGVKGVLAEKLKLTDYNQTVAYISKLSEDVQKLYASQLVRFIVLSGYQDVDVRNIAFTPNGELALFDTEPYGVTQEKVSDLVWRGLQNFRDYIPFSQEVKKEVLESDVPEKYRNFLAVKVGVPGYLQKLVSARN